MKEFLACLNPLLGTTDTHTHMQTSRLSLCVYKKVACPTLSLSSGVYAFSNFSGVIANWCELGENLPPRRCLLFSKQAGTREGKESRGQREKWREDGEGGEDRR